MLARKFIFLLASVSAVAKLQWHRSENTVRDQWASRHANIAARDKWAELVARNPAIPPMEETEDGLVPSTYPIVVDKRDEKIELQHPPGEPVTIKIGVLGAGAAGLFTGMTLDYLNRRLAKDNVALKFEYDIHEAAGPERVGGRLFTFEFGGERDSHDYYDVGAVKFPENNVMNRTFELFHILGMDKTDLETNPDAPGGSIIPFYYKNDNGQGQEPYRFNSINVWGQNWQQLLTNRGDDDPFDMAESSSISKELLQLSPDAILKANVNAFVDQLKKDEESDPPGNAGWDMLMEYDKLSTRQFLSTYQDTFQGGNITGLGNNTEIPAPPYDYDTVEWLETFNTGTGRYDQAFSEAVLDFLSIEYDESIKWYSILGGAQELARRMQSTLETQPTFDSPVTAIRALNKLDVELDVGSNGKTETHKYNALFSTVSLSSLRHISKSGAGLSSPVRQAIRTLGYTSVAKVAIKFKRAWWIHDLEAYSIKKGGSGHSDMNIRTCIYPSYNIYDSNDTTAVLLASITKEDDARIMGSLISTNKNHTQKVAEEDALKHMVLLELVKLHMNDEVTQEELERLIYDNYLDHHAWDWSSDPYVGGGYAHFGPQQFSTRWSQLIQPSGDVIIAGEHASPHHGWVEGAFESVIHGLYTWMGSCLVAVPDMAKARKMLIKADPDDDDDGFKSPFVGLPPYMNTALAEWQAAIGFLQREEHLQNIGAPGAMKMSGEDVDFEIVFVEQEE